MITPLGPFYYSINRGATWNATISLVSGNSSIPINLTGWQANLTVGPYLYLYSTLPTVSGNVGLGGTSGQIQLTISGSVTAKMYSPQQFYVGLTSPNGNFGVIMNGTMNFISPFNIGANKPPKNVTMGSIDTTVDISNWDDFVPDPAPPGSSPGGTGGGGSLDPIANN